MSKTHKDKPKTRRNLEEFKTRRHFSPKEYNRSKLKEELDEEINEVLDEYVQSSG